MTLLRALLLGLVILAGVVVGALVWFVTVETHLHLTGLRGVVENLLSRTTARNVTIAGELELLTGRNPQISISDLTIDNPDWAKQGPLLHIGQVVLRLDGTSLTADRPLLHELRLDHATFVLVRAPSGEQSWDFDRGASAKEEGSASVPALRMVTLKNVRLDLYDGGKAVPARITVERLVKDANQITFKANVDDIAFTMSSVVHQESDRITVDKIKLRLGDGEVRGSVAYFLSERPTIDAKLSADGFDLRPLLRLLPHSKSDDSAPDGNASTVARLYSRKVPTEPLHTLNATLELRGDTLFVPDPVFPQNAFIRDFRLRADLRDGRLQVEELALTGDRGRLQGSAELEAQSAETKLALKLKADDFRFGLLAEGTGLSTLPPHKIQLDLHTRGSTYGELAKQLNGAINFSGGKGRVKNTGVEATLGSFLNELVNKINPFAKEEPYTSIDCSAGVLDIQHGVIHLNPGVAIRTEKLDVGASGDIDLVQEQLDVAFRNAPRKGIGLSAAGMVQPYIGVGGSFSAPRIKLDKSAALISGTAAVATSGLSIVAAGLLDRLATEFSNPCSAVVSNGGEIAPASRLLSRPVDSVRESLKSVFQRDAADSLDNKQR